MISNSVIYIGFVVKVLVLSGIGINVVITTSVMMVTAVVVVVAAGVVM